SYRYLRGVSCRCTATAEGSSAASQPCGNRLADDRYHRHFDHLSPAIGARPHPQGDITSEKVAALIKADAVAPAAEGEGTVDGAQGGGKDFPMAPNGHVWRAGANEATKFTVSDDVLVQGQKLAAGAYSIHFIPGKDEFT